MSRLESVAAFVVTVVIVAAAVGAVSWNGSSPPPYTETTTTTTETIPCSTANSTQTSGGSRIQLPNFGPLLSNLSAISVVENIYTSFGNFGLTQNLLVLNRSITDSRPVYLVNVTVDEEASNVSMVGSNGFTTTTTTAANQTQMGSVLGLAASNGSMISVEGLSGESDITSQLTASPLGYFENFVSIDSTTSGHPLHLINSTVVTIGSNRMIVANFELPSYVVFQLQEGCGSEPPTLSTVATIANETIQAGKVPGTDLTLITLISESLVFQSNSTSPSGNETASIVAKVTSFTAH